jgi:hypothetical protein
MALPDICIVPCVIALQPNTPVGIMVGVEVIVGGIVAVGLRVAVGGMGVSDGVLVNADVGVRVAVGVGVRVGDGEGDGVNVNVAVLGWKVPGGAVTSISMDTRIVRALSPIIGPDVVDAERSINGTKLGIIG